MFYANESVIPGMITIHVYIYIIYTPNIGLAIGVSLRKREQGRFGGNIKGGGKSSERARESTGEQAGVVGGHRGSKGRVQGKHG